VEQTNRGEQAWPIPQSVDVDQQGIPAEVLSRPASAAVARFLGHRNLFTARVAGHETNRGMTLLQWEAANGTSCVCRSGPSCQRVSWCSG
jgi:ABC-type Fe3+/spermidine/putrescine transport system ATPase subunit